MILINKYSVDELVFHQDNLHRILITSTYEIHSDMLILVNDGNKLFFLNLIDFLFAFLHHWVAVSTLIIFFKLFDSFFTQTSNVNYRLYNHIFFQHIPNDFR